MSKKKMIRIIIIIFMVIFAFALVEIVIRLTAGAVKNVSDNFQKRNEEQTEYNSTPQKKQRQTISCLDNVFEALKDSDYKYVFDMLDENYREYMFHNDLKEFTDYAETDLKVDGEHEYTNIAQNGGLYQVTVRFNNGETTSNKRFTVKVLGENTCSIMIGEYTMFKKMTEVAKYSNLKFNLSYCYQTLTSRVYVIDIQNLTNDNISMDFTDVVKIISSNGIVNPGTIPNSMTIAPRASYRIRPAFPKDMPGESSMLLNVKVNGASKEVRINFADEIL